MKRLVGLVLLSLACNGVLGAATFAFDQRFLHDEHCLSVLESAISSHVQPAMRNIMVDEFERGCP